MKKGSVLLALLIAFVFSGNGLCEPLRLAQTAYAFDGQIENIYGEDANEGAVRNNPGEPGDPGDPDDPIGDPDDPIGDPDDPEGDPDDPEGDPDDPIGDPDDPDDPEGDPDDPIGDPDDPEGDPDDPIGDPDDPIGDPDDPEGLLIGPLVEDEPPEGDIRALMMLRLFGEGYTHPDAQTQAAVEVFIQFGADEAFLETLSVWMEEDGFVSPDYWVEYLLQVINYEWPVDEPSGPEINSPGMAMFGMAAMNAALGGLGGLFSANPYETPWDSKASAQITGDGLIETFLKIARPVENAFRTYEISMEFTVGQADYQIPGKSEPIDVIMVIDKTGSMSDSKNKVNYEGVQMTRIEAVKILSKKLAEQIMMANEDSRVGVVAFNTSKDKKIDLTSRGSSDGIYRPYAGSVTWVQEKEDNDRGAFAGDIYGLRMQGQPALFYRTGNGAYKQVMPNAKISERKALGFLWTYTYFEQTVYGATHFVPKYEGLSDSRTTLYTSAGGYQGVWDVWDAIDSITATGNTDILCGIRAGYEMLPSSDERKKVIILLTDGEANSLSDNVWGSVTIAENILPRDYANQNKGAMMEGQWTVEQGVDLYAVGFGVHSKTLEQSSWALSPGGTQYRRETRQYAAGKLRNHTGYPMGDRYFTTETADGLKEIFDKIGDTLVSADAVDHVVLTDVLSSPVMKGFDLTPLTGSTAKAINFTGNTLTQGPVEPDFNASFDKDTGKLTVSAKEPLATGTYRVAFELKVLPDAFVKDDGSGKEVDTNEYAEITYDYLTVDGGAVVTAQAEHRIDTSPNVYIPPLMATSLREDGVYYAGTEISLTGTLTVPNVSEYRIPDTWKAWYTDGKIKTDAKFDLSGEPITDFGRGETKLPVTVAEGIKRYELSSEYVTKDKYPLIYNSAPSVTLMGVEGMLTYTLSLNNADKGLFDILTCFGDSGQFQVALGPDGERQYKVRRDLGAVSAEAYVPYGYDQYTLINDNWSNIITISFDTAVTGAGGMEHALAVLRTGGDTDKDELLEKINQGLSAQIAVKVTKHMAPWFRDWAWKVKEDEFESEVEAS